MKIQNEKPTNVIKMRRLAIASIMVAIVLVMGAIDPVMASVQTTNNQIIPAGVALDTIKKNHPAKLSSSQLEHVKQIALSDPRVKEIINDKPFEFMSQFFSGDIKQTPIIWDPAININVNNQTDVAVEINMSNNSVVNVEEVKLSKSGPQSYNDTSCTNCAAVATDYYTGSAVISGVYATLVAPSYTGSPNTRFLVNGLESGASDNPNYACNSADEFNDYFGQGGFDFKLGYVMYTDTSFNCVDQEFMLTYAPSDPYLFEVYSSTGPVWNIVALDQYTGLAKMYTTSFTTYASSLQTSDPNTSVWFENQDTSTTWASDFTSSIQAYNAKYYSSGWSYWDSDSQLVRDCSGNTQTQNVMNSDLKNDDTQTWNLTNFEVWHC